MIDKQKLKQCYNSWAPAYDANAQQNPVVIKDHPIVLDLLKSDINLNSVGLDLGCGTGILTSKIAENVKEIIGLDLSKEMIAKAQSINKQSNVSFKIADISQRFDFPDNYFNFVISSLTLCHIDNLESVYKEIYRVLKKSGVFIFDEITSKLSEPFSPKYKDYLAEFGKENKIWQRHSSKEHLDLIKKTGFKVEKIVRTKIDEDLKDILKIEDYQVNYNCPFTTVFKLKK
ncbi:hypothetical protein A2V71_01795 [Candidatus Berkelbacteria bacterium RBG_13_40_8]|uniref:Methyltransferase type 11 domain-containing protein n=1 Tax=Candidatus Berkelbacteria bacterium RBG_13_40_8 TaxID=1797467 RepID=A0A1F5DQ27_9BACT|nr:MAG: hypothetical protein A2V71_01795 [Candidatus Berkelbacteria bacterium RBG_13_40_8]